MPKTTEGRAQEAEVWRPPEAPGLEVAVKTAAGRLAFAPSALLAHCIAINGAGSATVEYDRSRHSLHRTGGLVLLQRPGSSFSGSFVGQPTVSGACLELSASLVRDLEDQIGVPGAFDFRDLLPPDAQSGPLLGAARRVVEQSRRPETALARDSGLLALAVAVARAGGTTRDPDPRREHGPVRRVRRVLSERPQDVHRLADLAALAGLNPRYLIAAFRDEVGVTPHQYQLAVRVRASKDQLAGGRPVGDVAADLGFADQSHFTRVFRQHVRTTPGRFQRLSRAS